MTAAEIPPIVLLVDPHRESLERYSHCLEHAGFWVAATTEYQELLSSVDELRPDIIIADAEADSDAQPCAALEALKQNPDSPRVPLVVLVPPRAARAPEADVTLRKPVPPEFLLRRTREILDHGRTLRGQSEAIVRRSRTLINRSGDLMGRSAAIAARIDYIRRACPKCSTQLEWVEHGSIGGVTYDYFRWCPKGCGLYCFNRDAKSWIRLA